MRRFQGVVLGLLFVLPVFVLSMTAQEELCVNGTLLFREDFGGNDPSDPAVGRVAVSGMSSGYQQIYKLQTSDPGTGFGAGCYLVAKRGYRNSAYANYSVWHIMDDHTYFGDTTRGYLLEIDGKGSGSDVFYSTVIDGLCAGSRLTFSAYVANLTTAGQYNGWRNRNYVHPKLSFVITHPLTGAELARYNTDTIAHDWTLFSTPSSWQYSANWQLVGMNFTVPEGINAVRLSIRNNASGSSTGNDFAMDDIEIHLCAPPVTIEGETEACEKATTSLSAEITNDGTFAEPLEYKWWHSEDSVTWMELSETSVSLSLSAVQKTDSGWYKVAVSGAGNIENVNCRVMSAPFRLTVKECTPPKPELCMDGTLLFREDFGGNDPNDPRVGTTPVNGMTYTQLLTDTWRSMGSGKYLLTKSGYCNGDTSITNLPQNRSSQWHLQDDHTYPNDKTRGYLLEIDGKGDHSAFYTTTIDGLCEGSRLTFSAYVANVLTWGMYVGRPGTYAYPRLKFVLTDPTTNEELAAYDTGDIPFDSTFINDYACWKQSSQWHLVGMNFTVPTGQNQIKLTIYNNVTGYTGNDFAIDDIEIRLCTSPATISGEAEVCPNISTTLTADFTNDGTFPEPLAYKWWFSSDSLSWTELSETSNILSLSAVQKADSGWYKVAVASIDNIENVNCRAISEPFLLTVKDCKPPIPPAPEEFCMDGTLLFREDFGGNDPNEPRVSTAPVPGMYSSYTQVFRTESCMSSSCCNCDDMLEGRYTVTKQGYRNSYTAGYSIWHIMDDHTYPNDTTRGYFLEVDGKGGSTPIYKTTLNGLCAGLHLSFTTYIANIVTAEQYISWRTQFNYKYPKIKFVITDPQNGNTLAQYTTDTIGHDWSLFTTADSWKQSANWQLVGMSFVVPEGINQVELGIYNAVNNVRIGNDFAIDDIEIHLCMTPDTIRTDTIVCDTLRSIQWRGKTFMMTDTLRDTLRSSCGFDSIYYVMKVGTEHCEPPIPPCPEIHYATRDTTVCDTLMPFTWHGLLFNKPGSQTILLKDEQGCDSIEIDYTLSTFHCEDFCLEGKLLFREDFGGNDAGDSEISCAHVSGIANFYTNACQEVRKHPEYGMSTMNYVLTKKGQGNRQWHVQDDHTYPNNYTRGYFLEVDGYGGTIYKTTVNNLYEGMELTFSAYIANLHDSCVVANMRKNYGYTYPRFKFILKDAESNAELATYTTGNILPDITTPCVLAKSALWQLKGMKYVVPEGVSSIQMLINNDVASYDGNDFGIDDIEIRLCYMPAKKIVQDTIICDTIDNIVWRNKIYPLKNELRDTVYDSSGADSIYYILNVTMEHCCQEIKEKTITIGTLCDTLLPYTLYFRDTVLTFKMAGDLLLEFQHPQWDCIDSIYTFHLDTIHCERLYDIIVNKYNWQLLCHNVCVRELFPELTVTGYQWYKDGTAIPNATEDDYSEQNELQGEFQLRLHMSDGRYVWSEILTIQPGQTQLQSHIRIYNHNGYLFYQSEKETTIPSLPRGLYIIQIEQNGEQRIEKKLIP